MKKLSSKIVLSFIMALVFTGIKAQSVDNPWSVGLIGGLNQYNGDLGSGFFNYNQELYGFGGVSVARYLTPHLDVVIDFSAGEVGHDENDGSNNAGPNAQDGSAFRARMIGSNAYARYNFFKYDEVTVRPFVLAGMGYFQFNDLNTESDEYVSTVSLPTLGAGINAKISPSWAFLFQGTFMLSNYDKIDGETGGGNDAFLKTTLSLAYNLGKDADDDLDGVRNSEDLCPNVAGIPALKGCPDADGDGITDKNDKCPNDYGIKEFMGCPDSDSDGIADADDVCPYAKGTKEMFGCPDSDKDGIADKDDDCPNKPGAAELRGCPDTDGDGVADKEDECPKLAGPVENQGCPDSDGDGVSDNRDVCPKVPGLVENKGCPEVKASELKVLKEALYGIKFEVGKATITPNSYTILENVYEILNNTPQYKLQIHGHTDADGSDEMNLKLSKDRAAAVKSFLVKKGVSESRLTSEGFGETKPVATNETAAGKAQNRRVELEIKF